MQHVTIAGAQGGRALVYEDAPHDSQVRTMPAGAQVPDLVRRVADVAVPGRLGGIWQTTRQG